MSSRKKTEILVEKTKQDIADLFEQIKQKQSYLQGLQDVLKFLPKDKEEESNHVRTAHLRHGSDLARARESILAVGHPLHILKILEALGKEPTKENRVSLSGSLASYVRRKEFFTRPEPNTFGVVEFDEKVEDKMDSI